MMLAELNLVTKEQFTAFFSTIFEHSPWVASKAAEYRPFSSVEALHKTMCEIVRNSSEEDRVELFRAHPNLGDKLEMSAESIKEQNGAGLQNLSAVEYESFQCLNKKYIETFGFPFIFAVRGNTKEDIHVALTNRVNNSKQNEYETALAEIFKIALFRLEDCVNQHSESAR